MNILQLVIITETADELKAIMHAQIKAKIKERIQALYLLKAGIVNDIGLLAYLLGRAESTVRLWFARYQASGLSGLLAWNYHGGKPPALSETILDALRLRLQQPEGFRSYGEIQAWLAQEYGLEIPYKTVHKIVHYKLKAKLKVARPFSLKRQEEAVVDFKKNSRIVLK
jgi:transposase